jgi:murein DD-endopeptidase MepM/ murein hydrolase activator NlpD
MFRGSSLPTHVTGDYFSRYPDNTRHIGLDIERVNRGNSMERRIYAQGPGRVIYIRSNNNSEAGLFVVIRYDNGRTARYLHLYSISSTLSSNQRVDHTTPIGRVGNSGSASQVTWGRLHFDVNTGGHIYGDQIRQNNSHVNPARMFPDGTFTGTVGMGSSW